MIKRNYRCFQREDYRGSVLGFHRIRGGSWNEIVISVSEVGIIINGDTLDLEIGEERDEFVEVMRECIAAYDAVKLLGLTPYADFVAQAQQFDKK